MKTHFFLFCILTFSLPILAQKNEIGIDILTIPAKNTTAFFVGANYYRNIANKWDIGLNTSLLYQENRLYKIPHKPYALHYSPKIDVISRFALINKSHFRWSLESGLSFGKYVQKFFQDSTGFVIIGYDDYIEKDASIWLYGLTGGTLLEGKIGKHVNLGLHIRLNYYPKSLNLITSPPTLRIGYHW